MVKFPYQRLAQVFDELLAEILPQDELARRLSVSTRTVRNDIEVLNAILSEYGARFVLKRGEGYRLEADNLDQFQHVDSAGQIKPVPRSAAERIQYLLVEFLNSAYALKLQDLADNWNVSRATLQTDMSEVRERLKHYQLSIETRPHHGMKLLGTEASIRVCLSDVLRQIVMDNPDHPLLNNDPVLVDALATVKANLSTCLAQSPIRVTDDGIQFLTFYCAITAKRIVEGFPLQDYDIGEMDEDIHLLSGKIINLLQQMTGKHLSAAEDAFLCINIAGRSAQGILPGEINADDADTLVSYILNYINEHYRYDLRHDDQLRTDLTTHIKTMITRVRYQINLPNPVLADIKQHYALAYDITLAAISSWAKHSPYRISENEIGYLVLHIGVGLERHYHIGYVRKPQVMLVCDGTNATLRNMEAMLHRRFPQMEICQTLTCQEYDAHNQVEEDFIISTIRLEEKNKPIVVVPSFPSDYQLEQLTKLVLVDRTRPYMLDRYFSANHFMIADEKMTRDQLFEKVCTQLHAEGYVKADFLSSVQEREEILSTILGDGIALPHALGLFAKQSTIYTIIAPHGIQWGDGVIAKVIFLLALSKAEYEKAIAIYDIFVSFVRGRATARLADSQTFEQFKETALACLTEC